LLWTAWGVGEARVVGALEGKSLLVNGVWLVYSSAKVLKACIPKKMVSSLMFCLSGGGIASVSI